MDDEQTPSTWTADPPKRWVSVWPHTLVEFEMFPDAHAQMTPNGALFIFSDAPDRMRDRPIKVYAPGSWVTVEHLGDWSQPTQAAPATEQTTQLPKYRDPMQDLDPDELARTNGDVSPSVGTGTVVPYPKPAQGDEATETADEGARAGVVKAAPKAVTAADTAGARADTDDPEPPDWGAGVLDLVKYAVGWPYRRPRWAHLPDLRRFWPRSSARPPLGSDQRMSPAGWMALSAVLLLPVLVQTLQ